MGTPRSSAASAVPSRMGAGQVVYGLYVPNAPNLIAPELFDGSGLPTVEAMRALDLERRVHPQAIVVDSPHFLGRREFLAQVSPRPKCLHDFGGFDPRLYDASYEPPGSPALGAAVVDAALREGLAARTTTDHGLDHGAWAPLLHLAPSARVPVLPVSISGLGPEANLAWGRSIAAAVRDSGERVAFVATGSILHRLDRFDPDSSERWEEGALAEQELVGEVLRGKVDALMHFDPARWNTLAPEGNLEPLFALLGAMGPEATARLVSTEQAFGAVGLSVLEFQPHPA